MRRRALSADGHRRLCLLTILFGEPEAEDLAQLISRDPKRLVSALSALEAAIVIHFRKGPFGIRELDLLVHSAGATIVTFDADQVLLARSAYEKFVKGHHPVYLADFAEVGPPRHCSIWMLWA